MSSLPSRSFRRSSARNAEPLQPGLLPDVDIRTSRIRRSARRAVTHAWFADRGRGLQLDIGRHCPVRQDALVIVLTNSLGCLSLLAAPEDWPALASAANLSEGAHRRAVASLLFREHFATMADEPFIVDLQTLASPVHADSGVSLRYQGLSLRLLHIDDEVLAALESRPTARLPAAWLGMRVPARVLLGCRAMTRSVIWAVRQGDVVLLPLPPKTSARLPLIDSALVYPATCVWGDGDAANDSRTIKARVLLQNDTMTFLEKPSRPPQPEDAGPGDPSATTTSETSSVSIPAPQESSSACDLECLELLVHFELAGPLLRLADIADLGADDVLELGVPVEHARVRILVARQSVGIGELVVVAGRLGVRVLHMKLGDGAEAV